MGMSYSTWKDRLLGVALGSTLGPPSFSIFLCDLFIMMKNVQFCSYTAEKIIR